MTTKEKIVDEALSLFSVKGYNGTSVKNIADAVGIKDSSLYKHFKSKQEILDTIVETIMCHIEENSKRVGLPSDWDMKAATNIYANFEENRLVELSKEILLFYLRDPLISRFWRMGNIERFRNEKVYIAYKRLFLTDSIKYQTALFKELSKAKIFIDADPQVMALSFYSPIFFLLSKYANDTDHEEEVLDILDKHVREFCRIYRKSNL